MENSERDGNTRPPDLPPEKPVCMSQQLELDMEKQTGSKYEKEYAKVVYCHYAELDEAQAGIKIARRNINNLMYADDTTLMAESDELKLMKLKE